MSLTVEQIQFIDNYLKNEGIEYLDIRVEMIDHVASGVEIEMKEHGTLFYEAFKKYMLLHKKGLLNSNRKFLRSVDIRLLKNFFSNAWSLQCILVFIMGYIGMNFLISNLYSFKAINMISTTISIGGGFLYFILFLKRKKWFNFSAIQRLGLFFVLISQLGTSFGKYLFTLNSLQELSGNKFYILSVSNALLFTAYYLMLVTGIQYKKAYKKQFIAL